LTPQYHTSQSVVLGDLMTQRHARPLSPTLWRTCRALANRTRLRILKRIMSAPEMGVSEVARVERIPTSVASEYLRALNARGLLHARRRGKRVLYSAVHNPSLPETRILLHVLRRAFRTRPAPFDAVFRALTAFTHPRRIALFRAAASGADRIDALTRHTRISRVAAFRHLAKLRTRECIVCKDGIYRRGRPSGPLTRTLMNLALRA
jgi:DNA-binding transcriptional ArsR family regulator